MAGNIGSIEIDDGSGLSSLLETYQTLVAAPSPPPNLVAREVEAYNHIKAYLTLLAQQLAQDAELRELFVSSNFLPTLLQSLSSYYAAFERVQAARPAPGDDEPTNRCGSEASSVDAKEQQQDPYYRASYVATLCFRVLRNAMAGCAAAQATLCNQFDLVAPFLANITRFHTLNDPDTLLLSRAAVQMLSNLITSNHTVQRQMWPRIVATSKDDDKLVLKFLSSSDTATQSAAQVLLINFLRSLDDDAQMHERCFQLCTLPSGLQLVETLLSSSDSMMLRTAAASQDETSDEYEPESEIQGLEESLGLLYTIFAILFESGYSSLLVSALAPVQEISSASYSSTSADLPIISSSQLTLLKLLDGWLHVSQKQVAEPERDSQNGPMLSIQNKGSQARNDYGDAMRGCGLDGLVDILMRLSSFARVAMAGGIAKSGESRDQQPQDRRLIGVHRGLLLLLQCLLSISMTADGWSGEQSTRHEVSNGYRTSFGAMSRALLSDMRRNEGLVDELVALLDQTHQYAPALSPFRPTEATSRPGQVDASKPLPQGHALSSTGQAAASNGTQPSYGFDHLKRDIVRVLGSLVYAPAHGSSVGARRHQQHKDAYDVTQRQIRQVQDRVRSKGGLLHVLNMTVLDERNPYMREHAIFALRYLLAGNSESQSLVASLEPAKAEEAGTGMQLPMV